MPTTKLISSINDSVEKAMEKLTELRLTFQMKELNKQQQSSSSALGTPLADLTSSLSNLLTAAAVDLRSAVRLQKLEDEEREKDQHPHHNHVGSCSECAVVNNNNSSSSSSRAFCIHKSALADRVIDRTFDQHKAMLREELKEVKSELEKFKSGAAYQTLRQRIDELELKLREEKMKKKNEMHRSNGATDDEEEKSERKQQFSINRNERDQIVSVSSFEEEKKRGQAKVIDKNNNNDTAGMFSLATVDDMIANFKNRCEDRAQKRKEVEESVQLEREKEQQEQQEQKQSQQQRIVEGEKSRKENKQLDTLLLNSLIRNFNHLLAAHRQEEAKIVERKADLLFLFMSKIMMAKTHHEPHLPPLSATPRVPSAPQQNDEDGESLQKSHIITSGRRRNSSSSSNSRKKILDVTPKPLHEKMNSMMTTTSGRRW